MFFSPKPDHALVTVYAAEERRQQITKALDLYVPEFDIKILTPENEDNLLEAARHSVLALVAVNSSDDSAIKAAKQLQDDPLVVCDIFAFLLDTKEAMSPIMLLAKGFDLVITKADTELIEFKKFLSQRIVKGAQRLKSLIQEEEFSRLNDALSISPVSIMVFDKDKRVVFVSDHYFRAYPKIAPRLIRGLRVYDAFDMMAREEELTPEDKRYKDIKTFWYNLDGRVEFTLDNGVSYRLKAIKLPKDRGTVIIGQNMTELLKSLHPSDFLEKNPDNF